MKLLFVLILLIPFALSAQKTTALQKPQSSGRIYAIIIGVADYSMLPKLQFADKDALEFYLYLRKLSAADTNRFFIFLNSSATRNAIALKFYQIATESRPGDRVFIYFSGHGDIEQIQTNNNFFLLLGKCSSRNYMASSNNILEKYFFDYYFSILLSKKVKTIFICDACHSGKLIGGEQGKKINHDALLNNWSSEIKLLSCQSNQTSIESTKWGGGRSVFSYYLVLGLKGLADTNNDRKVSLAELNHYLSEHVKEGALIFNQEQWPSVSGNKDFTIGKTSETLLKEALRQVKQNSVSDDYRDLSTEKGKKIKVANNIYVYKVGTGAEHLQLEDNFTIKDTYLRAIYFTFKNAVNAGYLVFPEQSSGHYYYNLLIAKSKDSSLLEEARMILLNGLLQSYEQMLNDFYSNNDSVFYSNLFNYRPQNLILALELSPSADVITNQIKSRQFFLQACMYAPSTDSVKLTKNTAIAISVLQQAIQLDSLNPALYAKLSELYLTRQQYKEALDACSQYQDMLPNDPHTYNRKGLIYLSLREFEAAATEFRKALQLAPDYREGQSNLLKAQLGK